MKKTVSTRRRFLSKAARTAAAAGGAVTAAAFGAVAPAPAIREGRTAPSETVVLSVIGCGGRGSTLARDFVARGDVEIACACDPDLRRAASLSRELREKTGKAPAAVQDYRKALEDRSVDAVIVATPDHWHALATVAACQAGKDVYVEKPASYSIWEGRKMVEAARKYGRVVQVGTQNRSAPEVIEAVEYVRSGALGKVHFARVENLKSGGPFHAPKDGGGPPEGVDYDLWLGPAPARPFNAGHFHGGWYYFFAYCGGDMGNDSSHQLDIARWVLGRRYPRTVYATGGNLAFRDDRDVPDTQVAVFEFDDDLVVSFELTQWAPYMDKIAGDVRQGDLFPHWPQCATRIELYGTKGLMVLGRHGGGWQVFEKAETVSRAGKVVAQRHGRIPDPAHKENFIQCVRTRERPNADIEEGHVSAVLSHLGNIAYRVGSRKLVFDGAAERFVGDEEANRLLKREFRAPYAIPDEV